MEIYFLLTHQPPGLNCPKLKSSKMNETLTRRKESLCSDPLKGGSFRKGASEVWWTAGSPRIHSTCYQIPASPPRAPPTTSPGFCLLGSGGRIYTGGRGPLNRGSQSQLIFPLSPQRLTLLAPAMDDSLVAEWINLATLLAWINTFVSLLFRVSRDNSNHPMGVLLLIKLIKKKKEPL